MVPIDSIPLRFTVSQIEQINDFLVYKSRNRAVGG